MSRADRSPGPPSGRLTLYSLAALLAALALGILGNRTGSPLIEGLGRALELPGSLWVSALRMTVIPLVLTQLLTALTASDPRKVGRLGARMAGVIVPLLAVTGILTVAVVGPVARRLPVDSLSVDRILESTALPPAARAVQSGDPVGLGEWLVGIVPANPFEALANGEILPALLFALLFGVAAGRLPAPQRAQLEGLFRAVGQAMLVLVFWVLRVTPLGVFALVLGMTLQGGVDVLGMLLFYIALVTGWILLVTGALYPLAAWLGAVSVPAFARAAAPGQVVAVGTRSSLAALPAMIDGGRRYLGFSPVATGFVLPLASSVFKMSTLTAEPVRYVLLAHVFGMSLTLGTTATFLATLMILSLAGIGVPRGGSGFDTLPAYAAAGIPLEGLVLVVAVDTIPDIAKTIINVTGQLAVATIVTRDERAGIHLGTDQA